MEVVKFMQKICEKNFRIGMYAIILDGEGGDAETGALRRDFRSNN